jgi:hypothetical protein
MIERIQINQLWKPIQESDFLIAGSPKGVGFSSFIAEWAAEKMFLNDSYSILILTENKEAQEKIISDILKAHKYYHFDGIGRDKDIVFSKRDKGSVTGVFCYNEIDLEAIDEFYDVIIVDSDDFSNRLYSAVYTLMSNTAKLIFNTYDLPQSIYYNFPEVKKVILSSEYNKKLRKELSNTYSSTINFDRILDGKFE